MLDFKTGKFAIDVQGHRTGGEDVLANHFDQLALIHYYNQPEVEFVGRNIASQVTLLQADGVQRDRTPWMDFIQDSGRTITTKKSRIRYHQRGTRKVNFRLTETVTNPTPGLGRAPFTIKLNTNVYKPGDRLAPEEAPDQQVTVQSKNKSAGGAWAYTVEYHGRSKAHYFPPEYLVEFTRWKKGGSSSFAEGSPDWGSTIYEKGHAVVVMEVGLWKTGKELKITDDALHGGFVVATEVDPNNIGPNGQPMPAEGGITMVELLAEANMQQEARIEQEQDLFWGISSMGHIKDVSAGNRHRQTGAGAMDFMADGHNKYYTPNPHYTSMSEITEYLDSIMEDQTPANSRYIFQTGRPGLKLADKLIKREFGDTAVVRDVDNFLDRMGFIIPGGVEAFKMKNPMFNAYEIPTHGLIQFQWTPNFGAKHRGGPRHPRTGEFMMGYWMVCFDLGFGNGGGSNIVFVRKENSRVFGYETGAIGLNGGIQDDRGGFYRMVSGERAVTLRHGESYGQYFEDLNKLVRFLPNVK